MSKTTRWILAILMAIGTTVCSIVAGAMIFMPYTFGTTCMAEWLLLFPLFIVLGALTGSILFGMGKRRALWLGVMAAGLTLALLGYAGWFAVVARVCN